MSTSTGPGRPLNASRNARGITCNSFSVLSTRKLCFTTGRVMPEVSTSWKASVPIIARGTCPVIATNGIESSLASAIAVTRFVAPGPEEATQTAASPVARAQPWAMKPAPCSWRASTWVIFFDSDNAS
jgi:hypothetical protein